MLLNPGGDLGDERRVSCDISGLIMFHVSKNIALRYEIQQGFHLMKS